MNASSHSSKFQLSRRFVLTLACGLGALAGCGGPAESPEQDEPLATRELQQPLLLSGTKWPRGQVPVCWDAETLARPDFATRSVQVRRLANNSWPTVANVEFTGWGACPANTAAMVVVRLQDSLSANTDGIGYSSTSARIMTLGVNRSDFDGGLVPHEFGHVLGFAHEMARSDFPDDTSGPCAEGNVSGDILQTPPDRQSIMASDYCQTNVSLSGWDVLGSQNAYGRRAQGFSQLLTAWSPYRTDHASVATQVGRNSVAEAAYAFAYVEGWLFDQPAPGTVPLKLYYNSSREDNFTLATSASESAAQGSGYYLARTEGYLYPTQQPGTVPLKTFWSSAQQDYFMTSTSQGEAAALASGYELVRIEGYLFQDVPYALGWAYWNAARTDNLLTSQGSSLAVYAGGNGYEFSGFDNLVLKYAIPGTAALKTYRGGPNLDHFATGTAQGELEAVNSGYSLVGTEGYVFTSQVSGSTPLNSYWNPTRRDNYTTSSRGSWATGSGYALTRAEGYVYAINSSSTTSPAPSTTNTLVYSASNTSSATMNTVNQGIALTAGQTLTLGTCGVTGASYSGDTYLRLYNPSGTQVAYSDDACGGTGSNFTYTVPAGTAGTYQLRAGCYSSGSCSGTVAWTISGGTSLPPSSGTTLTYSAGNTNSAQANTVNQTIALAQGQTITVGTCGVAGASFTGDTYLRLYGLTGYQVAANDNACGGAGSSITYTVPIGGAGYYELRAGCYSSGSCSGTVVWTVAWAVQ
ncbi:hypothetical protein NR798_16835 [Archangium gephyra]|uniref:hypothetical protein n=1 Tax=Archangium gephyra TaxID=48 RepID=UPI0035D49493